MARFGEAGKAGRCEAWRVDAGRGRAAQALRGQSRPGGFRTGVPWTGQATQARCGASRFVLVSLCKLGQAKRSSCADGRRFSGFDARQRN